MSQVLVVGGAGYIGSHTVNKLIQSGHEVVVIDNLSTGSLLSVHPKAVFHQADVLNVTSLQAVFEKYRFDAILHFAAKLSVPESFLKFDEYFETNVNGTHHLLKMCRQYGVKKFIFSSTAAVYGHMPSGLATEDEPLKPENPYGQSKQMAEQLIQSFATTQQGFHYHILRYFNVAGAELDGSNGPRNTKSGQLVTNLCQSSVGNREINIFGNAYDTVDGTAVRDYIHVVDLASAHVEALKRLSEKSLSGIWNCGFGRGYTVLEVIRAFEQVSGVQFKIEFQKERQGDPARVVAATDRILQQSSWLPKHSDIASICKSAFDWAQSERN